MTKYKLFADGEPIKEMEDVSLTLHYSNEDSFEYTGDDTFLFEVGRLLRFTIGDREIYGRVTRVVDNPTGGVIVYHLPEEAP